MSLDISKILENWAYEPGQVSVRRIVGDDGRERIQLRLDLGVLQMETTGRPDGQRPFGQDSLLTHYEQLLQKHIQEQGTEEGFSLDEKACELLRNESTMFYHRYLAEYVLEDYAGVERDTMRNLRAFDFCKTYAKEASDRYIQEQYRPYVLMMCARARATMALRDNRPKTALAAVRKAIEDIRSFFHGIGQDKMASSSGELSSLKALEKEIESALPVDPIQKLKQDLSKAIQDERYEEAAHLRDQLRRMEGEGENR